ncbi:MAG: type II secretion system protein [Kiritimatiellae bacterium]|nr:type II secretion system protein [Kiritimatiellia bacterium]
MGARKKTEFGFSLLELLAVLSIMGLLTTLAVTSYFGAARGMARRGAVKHLANTLTLARQRACMDNARVSVVLYNEVSGIVDADLGGSKKAVIPSYVVCKEVGKISFIPPGNQYLIDEFNSLDTMFSTVALENASSYKGGFRLYNLTNTEGGFSFVYPWVVSSKDMISGRQSAYKPRTGPKEDVINAWCFEINRNVPVRAGGDVWRVGDSYGVEAAPVQTLPKLFEFKDLKEDEKRIQVLTFLPDGRALKRVTIAIAETSPPYKSTTVRVTKEGKVEYDSKW